MPSVPWGVAQDSPGHPRLSRARGQTTPLLAKVQSDPGSQFKGSHHGAKTRNKLAGSMHGELSRSHVGGALHDRAAHWHTWNHAAECLCPHRAPVWTSDSGWGLATNTLPRRLIDATAVIILAVGATVPADIDRKHGHRSSFATGQKCSQLLFAIGQTNLNATDALAAGHKHCNSSWCHGADMLPRFAFAY